MNSAENIRVAEFYAGIGGMHFALKGTLSVCCLGTGCKFKVVAAYELNDKCNDVYRHNFCTTPLKPANIKGLNVQHLSQLDANLWVMSPPCQPFTRDRIASAKQVKLSLPNPPKYFLLENVKGFEISDARKELVSTLVGLGYCYQEFLLSPVQLAIPNSRLRYYLVAVLHSQSLASGNDVSMELPTCLNCASASGTTIGDYLDSSLSVNAKSQLECARSVYANTAVGLSQRKAGVVVYSQRLSLADSALVTFTPRILDDDEYLVSAKTLGRQAGVLDVVTPESTKSCCFTKSYASYAEGTGSVLYVGHREKLVEARTLARSTADYDKRVDILSPLRLRYFTPREVANLMGFPEFFCFPPTTTTRQKYKNLGNSLNVAVVGHLVKYLLTLH